MKMIKHFPPHLSQLVFLNLDGEIEKINGLDYDLFIWLIYKTHKHYHNTKYHNTKDNYIEFKYKDIKESIPTKPNTNSIQSSLIKINEIQLLSNYLNSYENKEIILTTQPFKINIEVSDNGKSYGFSVTTSKKFLQRFDNPTPKVSVDYTIIYNLNKMSKLLYLFLKDALGVYENKNRKVDVDNLRHMMNVGNDFTSHSNFITQLKKSIIKNILIETYLDFESIDTDGDVSKINLKNLLLEIKNGKDEINILDSSVLFEFFYNGYKIFKESQNIDEIRLQNDTLNYYDDLHKKYFDDIDFKSLDKNNPITLQIMSNSIYCENFILIDWIKRNFNIVYFGE